MDCNGWYITADTGSQHCLRPLISLLCYLCFYEPFMLLVVFPPAPPGSPECLPGQFPCVDSVGCVDESARCDGERQCPTGSDEENCTVPEECLDSDWTCQNHVCIPKELRCNRQNDCMDNSDEEECGEEGEVLSKETQFPYWVMM